VHPVYADDRRRWLQSGRDTQWVRHFNPYRVTGPAAVREPAGCRRRTRNIAWLAAVDEVTECKQEFLGRHPFRWIK
jgi:hypothetical protein